MPSYSNWFWLVQQPSSFQEAILGSRQSTYLETPIPLLLSTGMGVFTWILRSLSRSDDLNQAFLNEAKVRVRSEVQDKNFLCEFNQFQ
mmetsp:Transcript_8624/g.16919  ORF Transcript_8624/g.16919 Transcript_8624/m.16919 type:complete len:88 (+) Transcript_8624:144-407(+)